MHTSASLASAEATRRAGIGLCVVSAAGFGVMAIFATRAYAAGVDVTTLLATRFTLAAAVLWSIVAVRHARGTRPATRAPKRVVAAVLALGAVGYSAQSSFFFSALRHIDVSLTSLLLYTFPALVCAGAAALGRERLDSRKALALALATGGTALVLLGGGGGGGRGPQATGVLLGLCAGATYAVYVLVAETIAARIDVWRFSALVTTGAAATFVAGGAAAGTLEPMSAAGLGWVAAIALLSTVVAISAFLLGMARVGSSTAAIVSTVEPVLTVSLAVLLLGERLGTVQLLGAVLVIAAVLTLQAVGAKTIPQPASAAFAEAPAAPLRAP